MNLLQRIWIEDSGVLTFEWIFLVSLLTIGIVGGIAATRDAIIDELGDVCQAILALDQSYVVVPPLVLNVHDNAVSGASNSVFIDSANFQDDNRNSGLTGQTGNNLLDFDNPA